MRAVGQGTLEKPCLVKFPDKADARWGHPQPGAGSMHELIPAAGGTVKSPQRQHSPGVARASLTALRTVSFIWIWLILILNNLCLKSPLKMNLSPSSTSFPLGLFTRTRAFPQASDCSVRRNSLSSGSKGDVRARLGSSRGPGASVGRPGLLGPALKAPGLGPALAPLDVRGVSSSREPRCACT